MRSLAAWFLFTGGLLAQPFPKANPEKAFPELKIYDSSGSPLRMPREDWTGAARRPQQLAKLQAEVDEWMAKRRDRVEWVAGWWHDFVSPKDGGFLTWTAEEPGADTLSSPSDPKVQLTPRLKGGWVFGFRSRHAAKIEEAAALWRITQNKKYAEWAAAQLDFYAEHYLEWPLQTEKNPARLMHQSLDEAVNLVRYVRAARWLDPYVSRERRSVWIAKLFRPEAELLGRSLQRIHNIACWQRTAQAMAALYAGDEELWKIAIDGEFGIRAQVAKGITSDYLWIEQSLLYNNYVVTALLPLFTEAMLAGRGDSLRAEMAAAENLMLAPVYLRFPDGKLPTPADSTGGFARAPNRGMFGTAWRVFPTTIGREAAATDQSLAALIDPAEGGSAPAALPEVTSRHWESSRMAVLKKGGWQVYFHYGQLDSSHAQAEALNYEAYYGSADVTHDPGTVGYGSPLHRGFYTTGWADNVVMVDGVGQERWQPGEMLAWDPAEGRMRAAQPLYRKDVKVERELRVVESVLVDRVKVECAGATQRKIGLVLHLQANLRLPASWAATTDAPAYWEQARMTNLKDSVELPVTIGGQDFQLTLRTRGNFRLVHGITPDLPPNRRESLYLETNGTEAEFETRLTPVAAKN